MTPINDRIPPRADSARFQSYGIALLRIIIGVVFIAHAYLKLFGFGMAGTTGFMGSLGIPAPALAAWFSVLAESLGGLAQIIGIFTPVAGLALAVDMVGAIFFAKLHGGFFAPKGYELELTLLVASLALALTGPGAFSLRDVIRGNRTG
jgi:putative oxidoreductase